MNRPHIDSDALKRAKNRFSATQRVRRAKPGDGMNTTKVSAKTNHQQSSSRSSISQSNVKPTLRSRLTQSVRTPSRIPSSSNSKNKPHRTIRTLHRPDYMQVVSDRPNMRVYHAVNQPPPMIRHQNPPQITQPQNPNLHYPMSIPTIEKIKDTLGSEFHNYQKPLALAAVHEEIENLRQELKRDISDINQSIELMKQLRCLCFPESMSNKNAKQSEQSKQPTG